MPSLIRRMSEPKLAPPCRARTSVTTPAIHHRAYARGHTSADGEGIELRVGRFVERHVELQRAESFVPTTCRRPSALILTSSDLVRPRRSRPMKELSPATRLPQMLLA
jgi:hypothetical protein